jgi:hypothetical protein
MKGEEERTSIASAAGPVLEVKSDANTFRATGSHHSTSDHDPEDEDDEEEEDDDSKKVEGEKAKKSRPRKVRKSLEKLTRLSLDKKRRPRPLKSLTSLTPLSSAQASSTIQGSVKAEAAISTPKRQSLWASLFGNGMHINFCYDLGNFKDKKIQP